jgi:mannose-6-phosphate isomerase-like protein (cupin superfamily)
MFLPVSEAPQSIVSSDTTPAYPWGTGCLGWHLVQATDLSVIEEEMPPGTEEVRHRHLRSRQFFYVLHGSLTIECDGVRHQVGSHSGMEVAPMTAHQVRNESDGDIQFLVISQPPAHGDREVMEQ